MPNLTEEVQSFLSDAKVKLQENTSRIDTLERNTTRPYRSNPGDTGEPDNNTKPAEKILRKAAVPTQNPMLGLYLKGIVLGDWSGMDLEKRTALSSVNANGGYTLPMDVSNEIVDFARAKSVCFDAGVRTLNMGEGFVRVPRLISDPVGTWKAENADLGTTAITFDSVDLHAHTLVATMRCSIELFEDSKMINETMVQSLTRALGLQLDEAILRGTGSTMPTGIRNTTGVTIVNADSVAPAGGAQITRDMISNACQTIWSANGNPNSVIMSPREFGILDRGIDQLGQPLEPFPSYDLLSKHVTSSIPTNLGSVADSTATTTSELFVGDFTQVVAALRTNWTVEASRSAIGAFSMMQVVVRLYSRWDVGVLLPAHFVVIKNLIA
jgi:HK97 family phage major capsid protein